MMMGKGNVPIRFGRLGVVLLTTCLLSSVATADGLLDTLFNIVVSNGEVCVPVELIAVGIAVLAVAVVSVLINCYFCCCFICGKCCCSRQKSQPVFIVPPYPSNNAAAPHNNGILNHGNGMPEERDSDLLNSPQDLPSPLSDSPE